MSERNLRERLLEVISSNEEDTIIIIWHSKSEAYTRQEAITSEYLDFIRECSKERKVKEFAESYNFVFLARQLTRPISIGATIEALKNSERFFKEILKFCEDNMFSYIQIL